VSNPWPAPFGQRRTQAYGSTMDKILNVRADASRRAIDRASVASRFLSGATRRPSSAWSRRPHEQASLPMRTRLRRRVGRSALIWRIRLKFSELVRLFEQNGFKIVKEKGSIRYYGKPDLDKLIRVDYHGSKEVPTATCHSILKAAGITTS